MTRSCRRLPLIGLGAIVSFIGCTTVEVRPLRDPVIPRVEDWKTVAIYDDCAEISEPFEEVAVLEVSSAPTKEEMLRDCQRRAAAMGANGILVEKIAKHRESDWCEVGGVPVMIAHDAWHGRVLAILETP
jgi:hypothetical protein